MFRFVAQLVLLAIFFAQYWLKIQLKNSRKVPMFFIESFKVLAVMSYEEANPWCIEIKDGRSDAVLEGQDHSPCFSWRIYFGSEKSDKSI